MEIGGKQCRKRMRRGKGWGRPQRGRGEKRVQREEIRDWEGGVWERTGLSRGCLGGGVACVDAPSSTLTSQFLPLPVSNILHSTFTSHFQEPYHHQKLQHL